MLMRMNCKGVLNTDGTTTKIPWEEWTKEKNWIMSSKLYKMIGDSY